MPGLLEQFQPSPINKTIFVKHDGGLKETDFKSKKKRGDCVVRAITIALSLPYEMVFKGLCDLAKETGFFPNDDETFNLYLEQHGWIKNKPQRGRGGGLKSLENFNSKDITAIVKTRGHLVCISDGTIYDTYDCKFSCAYSYWTKSEEKKL